MRLHLLRLIVTATIIAVLYIFLFQSVECNDIAGRLAQFLHPEEQVMEKMVPTGDGGTAPLKNVITDLVEDAKIGAQRFEEHEQKKFEETQKVLLPSDPADESATP